MDKETARKFIPMVNDPEFHQDLLLYVGYRIELLRRELESAELTRIQEIQGQLRELRLFMRLKEDVLAKAV